MKHRVFISHSSKDAQIAQAICHHLEAAGIPCWMAPRNIDRPDWAASIMGGIRSSDVFVVILSENSIPFNEVMKEVAEATRVCEYILPFKIDAQMLSDGMQYHLGPIHRLDAVTPPMEKRILELRDKIRNLSGSEKAFKNQSRQKIIGKTVRPRPFFVARAIAGAYFNAGDEKNAEPYYFLGLEHMLKKPEENYNEVGFLYQKVGRCAYSNGDFAKAKEYLEASLKYHDLALEVGAPTASHTASHDTYVEFARMHMAMGDYETAIAYSQKCYDLLVAARGGESTSSAYSLSDMGICHSYLGNYDKAAEYLQRALDLNIRFNGQASMVTVRTRESIADNLARQGDVAAAKRAYLLLELEMEKSFGSNCPQVQRLREKGNAIA